MAEDAASQRSGSSPLRTSVLIAVSGRFEPPLPIRRLAANGSFWPFVWEKSDSGATDMHLPPSFTDAFGMELRTAAALAS
jgi:hypothetical protein